MLQGALIKFDKTVFLRKMFLQKWVDNGPVTKYVDLSSNF